MPKQFPYEITYQEDLGSPTAFQHRYWVTVLKPFLKWAESQGLARQCHGERIDTLAGFGIAAHDDCCVRFFTYKLGYAETVELWLTTVATIEQLDTFIEGYKNAIAKRDRELRIIKNNPEWRGRIAWRKLELKRVRNQVMKIRRERLKTA